MGVSITYMGTKRELAPAVANVIAQAKPGILLDAFSGMCSVGEQVAPDRQVWSNDIQLFSAEVAAALFRSRDEPPPPIYSADRIYAEFVGRKCVLGTSFERSLRAEELLLGSKTLEHAQAADKNLQLTLRGDISRSARFDGNLFTTTYANTYFGTAQAIELDAIYYSIAVAARKARISADQRRWMLIALGRAMLKCSNSTGHFAQFLKLNPNSYKKAIRQKSREIWPIWIASLGELRVVGDQRWRRGNRSFNEDSLQLLRRLKRSKTRPSVIYADPPYTDDQYSRYYHVLDTLILYDYPVVSGAGLYRPGRFTTPFSVKSKVVDAFDELVKSVSQIKADLVLSYPTNGLLYDTGHTPEDMLKRYFSKVQRYHSQSHSHSTFGASKGSPTAAVTEAIYLAKS